MSIYDFYIEYILTGKALLLSTNFQPLKTYLSTTALCIEYSVTVGRVPFEIPHTTSINSLTSYGLKIALVTDPVYITASLLTGVISIPVPVPDELPF